MSASIAAAMIGAGGSILQNKIQNQQSKENIEHAAAVNYGYGEMSADSADARTRALYSDLYSPEAKVKQLKEAGLSVGLMYGQGGAGGTSSTAGAQGQGAGGQQGKQPIGILQGAELGLMAAQAKKLEAEADNLNQDTKVKEKQTQKLAEEVAEVKANVARIEGETALQGWSQRQLMTISDSELNSYSEGKGWTKGWSEGSSQGTSQGTSHSEGKQFGGSVGVKVLKYGGNISGNYGYNESDSQNSSQNTSESKSENKGGNTSTSTTTSTSGSRNVVVWPKYDKNGNLEYIYMYLLTGDYKNISTEFRRD